MANDIHVLNMTRLRDISVAYGHAMPCAPAFLILDDAKFGGVVHTGFRMQGRSAPVPGGGPPTFRK
ncbi:MAG TPA: hypothetical protein VL485_23075 [Ktedonobacteraceae bacterium]|jgi:hypothetical protein|nr:hypothetical protein [Ktedonobacteraceae bacterium]